MVPALTRRQKAGSIFWSILSVVFGWSLFIYWWVKILRQTRMTVVQHFAVDLTLVVFGLLLISFSWIRYNCELASSDRRRRATRYLPPVFETDYLKRQLAISDLREIRGAAIVNVSATEEQKFYSAEGS